jgi:hypothetical protein
MFSHEDSCWRKKPTVPKYSVQHPKPGYPWCWEVESSINIQLQVTAMLITGCFAIYDRCGAEGRIAAPGVKGVPEMALEKIRGVSI